MKLTRLGWVFLVFLVFPGSSLAQTTLRYKFQQGEKLNYILEQTMTLKARLPNGLDLDMALLQAMDISWEILKVDANGKAEMKQKLERIRFEMKIPTGNFTYDSRDGKIPENPLGAGVAATCKILVGMEYSLTMDQQGHVSKVVFPKEFLSFMKGQPPFLGDLSTEDNLKKMLSETGLTLPEKPVQAEESWMMTHKTNIPKELKWKVNLENRLTYKGLRKKGGKTLEEISILPKIALDSAPPPGLKVKEGGGEGMAWFDNQAGRLQELRLTQNLVLEIDKEPFRSTTVLSLKLSP